MSSQWKRAVDEYLSGHLGVVSATQLHMLGCPPRSLANMVEAQALISILPGVYRSAQWPHNREQTLAAICARNPAAMLGFTTAGQLWAMRRMSDRQIHVLVPHGHSPEIDGVVVHRCRRVDPVDVVERPDGIRLTSPPRTLFDSADLIGHEATTSVLEQLLNDGRVTFGTVADTLQRLYHPRRPGSATMLAVIRSRPEWRSALQSDLEVRVLAEISRQLLPEPETQYRVLLPDNRLIVIDFAWPNIKLAVEVDHPTWHSGSRESHADKHRDRKLTAVGWTTTRITDIDVSSGLHGAIADVATILRRLQRAA
jgi:very-short-patch-repair endonuclease